MNRKQNKIFIIALSILLVIAISIAKVQASTDGYASVVAFCATLLAKQGRLPWPFRDNRPIGTPFKKGQSVGSIQIGVDPRTLTPKKNLSTLDSQRIESAVDHARNSLLEVTADGVISDGHHRLKDAINNRRPVDVIILFSGETRPDNSTTRQTPAKAAPTGAIP